MEHFDHRPRACDREVLVDERVSDHFAHGEQSKHRHRPAQRLTHYLVRRDHRDDALHERLEARCVAG